jgi:hypothetical protein
MSSPSHPLHATEQRTPVDTFDEKRYAADLESDGHSHSYAASKAHRVGETNTKALDEDVFVAKAEGESGPDFRGVGWGAAFVLLVKTREWKNLSRGTGRRDGRLSR